jgi:hypothetical protein
VSHTLFGCNSRLRFFNTTTPSSGGREMVDDFVELRRRWRMSSLEHQKDTINSWTVAIAQAMSTNVDDDAI